MKIYGLLVVDEYDYTERREQTILFKSKEIRDNIFKNSLLKRIKKVKSEDFEQSDVSFSYYHEKNGKRYVEKIEKQLRGNLKLKL